ncbi:uncharacterized protein LOC142238545 [Haematobia irritans]|uniref:uncharacterized protein LOC142238545 n=1 Tax=Haematobia irritans TaxID=7368 RepID=UPI003F500D5B
MPKDNHRRSRLPSTNNHKINKKVSGPENSLKPRGDCRICDLNHPLRACYKFRSMTVSERYEIIRRYRYCENCFALSHRLDKCENGKRCYRCGQKHNSMLHEDSPARETRPLTPHSTSIQSRSVFQRIKALHPTAVVQIKCKDEWLNVRVLINPCEPTSSIAPWMVSKFDFEVEKLGDIRLCLFSMRSRTSDATIFLVQAKISEELPYSMPHEDIDHNVSKNYQNLTLADPIFYRKAKINAILGAEIYQKIILPGLISGNPGNPIAQNSLLGWILTGTFGV